jgi:RES domain-containing protein
VQLWRICRKPYARKPLDGQGGLFTAGRWHTPRRLVVYASESLALASLEVLVHCDLDLIPEDFVAIEILIPPSVKIASFSASELPRNWRRHPAPPTLARLGNNWLEHARTAVLRVPSALVPTEYNYLLNPLHPAFRDFQIARRLKFAFDERISVRNRSDK